MDETSSIKTNREWKQHIHKGYWCICYDEEKSGEIKRIVLRIADNSWSLCYSGHPAYLVDPNGNRVEN